MSGDEIVVPDEGFGGQTKEQVEAALAAQAGPKVVANTAVPGLLAGKYKSVDALTKGYKEAESELGRLRTELAALKSAAPASTPAAPAAQVAPVAPAAAVETPPAGLEIPEPAPAATADPASTVVDFEVFAKEFADTGALSDDTYTKLQAQGISRKMADTYIAGIQAAKANAIATADKIAGGPEARQQVLAWAVANLTTAERNAFNAAVTGDDPAAREFAFRGLVSRWKDSGGGAEPTLVQPTGRSPEAAGLAFSNFKELSAAMKDPRYSTDPNYRKSVEDRAAISKL